VPLSVVGSRHVMLKGRLATYPGNVTLVVHDPIDTRPLAGTDPKAFGERVRAIIAPDAESDLDVTPPDLVVNATMLGAPKTSEGGSGSPGRA
jgi:hypothetical protein